MDISPVFYVHFIICAELISISCNPKSTSWKSHMIVRYPYQTWEKPPKINIILFSAYLASQEMKIWLNQFPLYTSVQETSHRFINTVFFPFFAFYPHCNTFYSDSNCWKMSCLLYIYIYICIRKQLKLQKLVTSPILCLFLTRTHFLSFISCMIPANLGQYCS